jgi:hypothetical protein
MSTSFSYTTTSSHDIVVKMPSDKCQSLSPPLQIVVRHSHENAVSYMSKIFSSITTYSHDIVMNIFSAICQRLFPPLQQVVTI